MNFGVKLRLVTIVLALGLMGALIVCITLFSQHQGAELHARLGQLEAESFNLSEHFKDTLRDVGDKLIRYRNFREEADWREFQDSSRDLKTWINDQKPTLKTQREKDILQQIDSAYADFEQRAQEMHDQPSATITPAGGLTDPLSVSRRRLFDLGQDLAKAHFDLRNDLLANASQTLDRLRISFLGLLGLLFLFGIALAVFVYRDMIRPLRVK